MNSDKLRVAEIEENALARGIVSVGSYITKEFSLDESTVNVHKSEFDGIGPRYGMQPVPFHAVNSQDISPFIGPLRPSSLAYSVATNNTSFWQQRKFTYAIFASKITQYDSTNLLGRLGPSDVTYFAFGDMQFRNNNAILEPRGITLGYTADLVYQSDSQWFPRQSAKFDKGMVADLSRYTSGVFLDPVMNTFMMPRNSVTRRFITEPQKSWYKTASFSVSGVQNEYKNIVGFRNQFQNLSANPLDWCFNAGSRQVNMQKIPTESSSYTITVLGKQAANSNLQLYGRFSKTSLQLTTGANPNCQILPDVAVQYENLNANINAGSGTSTAGSSSASISRDLIFLFQSNNFQMQSSYNAFFLAKESPVCAIYQDHLCQMGQKTSFTGAGGSDALFSTNVQYFDPTAHYLSVTDQTNYLENGVPTSSGFSNFPSFTDAGSLNNDSTQPRTGGTSNYCLGVAGSGLLRANTTYELTFSIFDKSKNTSGNVAKAVKFRTGAIDFVALSVYRQANSGPAPLQTCNLNPDTSPLMPVILGSGYSLINTDSAQCIKSYPFLNHLEIRFYYRAIGTFDWLPTSKFDFAEFYYDPVTPTRWVCQSAIAALPGGVPGGIVDNSALTPDAYFDVAVFQGYVFWMSSYRMCWSNKNDVFTYPVLNSVNFPKGYAKGMIEHVYPGQSTQDSRLLIMTSEGIYAARFEGYLQEVSVRVDPFTSATFARPGSNFRLTFWTSNIPFSSRSCAIAKGVLYYWGPTGIFRDVGNELPDKSFSTHVEPFIFDLIDKSKADDIHAIYNDITKEVLWFFPPKKGSSDATKALVFNIQTESFFIFTFGNTIVDSSQILDVQLDRANNTDLMGQRLCLHVRDATDPTKPQQTVFFDSLCDSGDVRPLNIAFCSGVAVQGLNRRLTVTSAGVALPTTGNLTVNKQKGFVDSAMSLDNPDGIYQILGGNGTTFIDIAPINGSWTGFDFILGAISNVKNYFPVFWASEHGFNYKIVSDYYLPGGMQDWWRFVHCHQAYRVDDLLRSFSSQQVRLKFRTILGTDSSDRDVPLTNNSRGMCQAFSQINFTKQNHESQAISVELTSPSGLFCGSRWKLQYLAYHCLPQTQGALRTFEL